MEVLMHNGARPPN